MGLKRGPNDVCNVGRTSRFLNEGNQSIMDGRIRCPWNWDSPSHRGWMLIVLSSCVMPCLGRFLMFIRWILTCFYIFKRRIATWRLFCHQLMPGHGFRHMICIFISIFGLLISVLFFICSNPNLFTTWAALSTCQELPSPIWNWIQHRHPQTIYRAQACLKHPKQSK